MKKFYVIHLRKKIPYYLHLVVRNGAGKYYFFSPSEDGAMDRIPDGYEVSMNPKTKQPVLRKIRPIT